MPLPAHVKVRRECLSFVVLGATGNLAQKKLLPSLFNLYANGHLPPRTLIVCAGRPAHSDAEFIRITAFPVTVGQLHPVDIALKSSSHRRTLTARQQSRQGCL